MADLLSKHPNSLRNENLRSSDPWNVALAKAHSPSLSQTALHQLSR